ncbi:MAG: carbohydrate kinase family protein [Chloroflexi bacterium]|nr:carbohydrate kinase family protein [Chloroflexota bacterium]
MRYDVLVFGDYCCDLIFTGLPRMPAPGEELYGSGFEMAAGGTFNAATAMHRLGLKVGWAGDFGNDAFSQFALAAARREGLDEGLFQFHDRPQRRVTVAASFPQDRAFLSYTDPGPSLSAGLKALPGARARAAYLPGLLYGPLFVSGYLVLRGKRIKLVMDCQSQPATLQNPQVRYAVQHVDVFVPNSAEARHLTGTGSTLEALQALGKLCRLAVIKDGPDGAHAIQDGRTYYAPALPVTPVDTTGAGDCFSAGFMAAWLAGRPLEECLRWGNIAGGLSTTARGGATAAPTLEQLRARL